MADPQFEVAADDRPLFAPRRPPVRWGVPMAIDVILTAAAVAYYLWEQRPEPQRFFGRTFSRAATGGLVVQRTDA